MITMSIIWILGRGKSNELISMDQ